MLYIFEHLVDGCAISPSNLAELSPIVDPTVGPERATRALTMIPTPRLRLRLLHWHHSHLTRPFGVSLDLYRSRLEVRWFLVGSCRQRLRVMLPVSVSRPRRFGAVARLFMLDQSR